MKKAILSLLISVVVYCIYSPCVYGAALYLDSNKRFLVRSKELESGDAEYPYWSLVKSSDVVLVSTSDLYYAATFAAPSLASLRDHSSVLYESGLIIWAYMLGSKVLQSDNEYCEVAIGFVLNNIHGTEKVSVDESDFTVVDENNNEYVLTRCRSLAMDVRSPLPLGTLDSKYIEPGNCLSYVKCSRVPVGINTSKFKLFFQNNSTGDQWMKMRSNFQFDFLGQLRNKNLEWPTSRHYSGRTNTTHYNTASTIYIYVPKLRRGEIMVRHSKYEPDDKESENWQLLREGDDIVLNVKDIDQASYKEYESAVVPLKLHNESKYRIVYSSGLVLYASGWNRQSYDNERTELSVRLVFDNKNGKEKVKFSESNLYLVGTDGETYEISPCRSKESIVKKNYSPIINPAESQNYTICIIIPKEVHKIKIRYDTNSGEELWLESN